MTEQIRAAVQAMLDSHGDGWSLSQVVVCMALERVNPNGEVESMPWLWAPPQQPGWMTAGLIDAASELLDWSRSDD